MLDIHNASALVTGGASGLGAATARLLAQRGMKVVVVDRNESLGVEVAGEIGGEFAQADVTESSQVQAAIDAAVALGPMRVLINCAGIGFAARTLDREGNPFDLAAFQRVVDINLVGSFNCARLAAVAISKTEPQADGQRGVIINAASAAAFDGQIGQTAYSASKGGIVGMTLPLARDLAPVGIRVNTIAPGLIETPIYGVGESAEEFKQRLGQCLLFPKRFGTADEFATLALELVTNSYMNAETVRLDGGIRLPPK